MNNYKYPDFIKPDVRTVFPDWETNCNQINNSCCTAQKSNTGQSFFKELFFKKT